MTTIGLPVGWPARQFTNCDNSKADVKPGSEQTGCVNNVYGTSIYMGLGWLITALAVMLGAPFWFDALNKLMVIRSTVKPSEKSQPEASKDAQPATPEATQQSPPRSPPPDADFEPNTWAGRPNNSEGVL